MVGRRTPEGKWLRGVALAALLALGALAGCVAPGDERPLPDADPAPTIPSSFHDERSEIGGPSPPEDCNFVGTTSLATCYHYDIDVVDPVHMWASMAWLGRSDMRMWIDDPLGRAVGENESEAAPMQLEVILSAPGMHRLYVQVSRAYSVGVQFFPLSTSFPGAGFAGYLHGLSRPDPAWTLSSAIVEQYRTPSADGVELDTWVLRPPVEAPVPLVLVITPYYTGGRPAIEASAVQPAIGGMGAFLLERGYAVGISSIRGTGHSGGCMVIAGEQEARDSAAVIQDLADQPWSNGNVGLVGISYDGTTAQDVWVEAPPALKAIVPVSAISDLYKYGFVNGVPSYSAGHAFNLYYWLFFGAVTAPGSTEWMGIVADPSAAAAASGEACSDRVTVAEGGTSSALDGNKDAYWQERDFLKEFRSAPERPRAAVFYVHGLQDWNVKPHNMDAWLEAVQASGVPFKAWLGQWDHDTPTRTDWPAAVLGWFDQFLREVDTGILDAPEVQVQDDAGTWRHEPTWPPLPARAALLHPNGNGSLSTQPGSGTSSYIDLDPSGALFGEGLPTIPQERIVWESEVLGEDLHISGAPSIQLRATSSGPRASILLTLVERMPEGDRPFNFAAQSLNHARSLESGEPDIAGQPQDLLVRFFPQDDVVHAGSRLVLVAGAGFELAGATCPRTGSSCPAPALQPIGMGSTVTLDLSRTHLELPLIEQLLVERPQPPQWDGGGI